LYILTDSKHYGHHLFRAFDVKNDGQITFEDFIIELSHIVHGTCEERLEWLFRLYDINNDGVISREEISTIVGSLSKLVGELQNNQTVESHANEIFNRFPTNCDGEIEVQGFCDTCNQDSALMTSIALFNTC